jgi:PAS domain S-box-containing protein
MKTEMEQFPATNPNPVLSVGKDGTILYSNMAGKPLLREWGVEIGEKLPPYFLDVVNGVTSINTPQKMEVRVGNRIYLVDFHPLLEDERVNIYGFDISDQKELEEKLRESEEKYRKIVETTNEGVWIFNAVSETTYVNEKMVEMLGYNREELIGRFIWDFADEEDKGIFQVKLANRKKGIDEVYELKLVRKKGSYLWVLVSAKAFFDDAGKFAGSLGMFTDITERKKTEEALKKAHDSLEEKVKERTAELEKAYNSLKESQEGSAEAQKMAHIGNWEWDVSTDKAHWSDELYRIFGRNPQELAPSHNEYSNYVHPEDRNYVDNSFKEATINGKPYSIDHRIILATGEERTVHIQSTVIFNEENNPIRIKGIVQDITEHRKAEEKIQMLANVVESSNDVIVTRSLDGNIISWNKGAEKIHGYSAEEIIGRPISILEPDNLKGEMKQFSEKIIQGKMIQPYETLRLRKDGSIINVSVTLSPVIDSYGKLVAISSIARDITESKKAKEEIQNLANVVESSSDAIITKTLDGNIISWNKGAEQVYGYSAEEIIGRPISIIEPDWLREEIKQLGEMIKQGENIHNYETSRLRKDGTVIDVSLTLSPVFDASGKLVAISAITRDITEKKQALEALANIEIARKKEIHHRIKNNLQVISSLLDLQADKFRGRKDIKDLEVLEAFKESTDRVTSMALIHEELHEGGGNNKLDFSLYLEKLVENLFQTYNVGNTNISLNMDVEDNTFFDMDTAVPLGIIVNELVSNSLKHAFPGRAKGEIRIKLCREKIEECTDNIEGCRSTDFILTISDNGIGIPKNLSTENLDTLGIQLVTTLVEQLDGELELKRNNGTEFTIQFTVKEKSEQAS